MQILKLIISDDGKSLGLQCTFIIRSDAKGCAVLVVNEYYGNYTKELLKGREEIEASLTVPFTTVHLYLCRYCEYDVNVSIMAFDVEMDGSIGSVAVPATYENGDIDKFCKSIKESGKIV